MGIGSLGWSPIKIATVTLTDSQIQTLPTIPVEIVAAPGSGKFIVPVSAVWVLDETSDIAGYGNVNADAILRLAWAGLTNLGPLVPIANISGTATALTDLLTNVGVRSLNITPQFFDVPALEQITQYYFALDNEATNKALRVFVDNGGSGNFTGGNSANTLKVTVYYTVVDL